MILLAVSGGPDSMFLLNDYKKKKNIVVAHINYKKRSDSDNDQKIVEQFCKQNQIKLEIHIVKEEPHKNFQKWARDIRYKFFQKIYKQYDCKEILMAHHNDDFIETAWMQQKSARAPEYFGIKRHNNIYGMNIHRPYIGLFWKEDLVKLNQKNNVPFAIDSTNAEPTYTRNKIRIEFSKKTFKEKRSIYRWFKMSNKILIKKNKKINRFFKKWERDDFELSYWRTSIYKKELLFKFIYKDNLDIKLSSNKIENIIGFLMGNTQSKKYELNKKYFIHKIGKKIKILSVV